MAKNNNKNLYQFLDIFTKEIMETTYADSLIIYTLNAKRNLLSIKLAKSTQLDIFYSTENIPKTWKNIKIGQKNDKNIASLCATSKKAIIVDNMQKNEQNFEIFDFGKSYKTHSIICMPLLNHENDIVGVLQLSNKRFKNKMDLKAFSSKDEKIIHAISSQIAVLISNSTLIENLEKLFGSFLEAMISAMKEESLHTYHHMTKMTNLSNMFVKAIHKDSKIFKDKTFSTDEQKAMKFAALLHDIGKLTTPSNILNKATKLQNIFDKIELIELRFENAKKCAKLYMYEKILENPQQIELFKKEYEEKSKEIDEDFRLIKDINLRGSLSDEELEKLKKIAKKFFVNDGKEMPFLSKDEFKSLKIKKGSLSKQERQIINNHANVSIKILEQLKLPKKYKKIPQISGAHHEKLNGRGYPKGLKGDEICFEARILAIADVFEALTSADRPYKKPNSISKAMKILFSMAKKGELDKDLVGFFYTSKLYLKYAKKYIKKEQIDEVNLDISMLK